MGMNFLGSEWLTSAARPFNDQSFTRRADVHRYTLLRTEYAKYKRKKQVELVLNI